jgi:hypothetical protein
VKTLSVLEGHTDMLFKLSFKPFGNNGIAWFFPLIFVWGGHPEVERVILNEKVHRKQWVECGIVGFPLIYLYFYLRGRKRGLTHWNSYYLNPMEIDSRKWDDPNTFRNRPAYDWWNNN